MTDTNSDLPDDAFWGEWAEGFLRDHLRQRQAVDITQPTRHRLTGDERLTLTGPYRVLTVTVIDAALRYQAALQHLGDSAEEAAGLWLRTPDGGGVEELLRFTPYAAVRGCPEIESGAGERARLLEAATGDPDGRLLWQRVSAAAGAVVEGVIGFRRETTLTMQDQVVRWYRRSEMDRVAEAFED